jgi:hypothetical protein
MGILTILGIIVPWLVNNGPALVQAGVNTYDLIMGIKKVYDENKVVGDPTWDALEDQITTLHAGALRDRSRDV